MNDTGNRPPSRRTFFRYGAAAGVALAAPGIIGARAQSAAYGGGTFDAGGETLRLAMWGGTFEATLRQHLIPDFEREFNCKIQYDSAFPWFPKLVAAGPDRAPYDLVNMNVVDLMKTRRAGNFFVPQAELRANLPNAGDLWDFAYFTGIGVTWVFTELGYAYRTDALAGGAPPADFKAFWESRFDGKRANFTTTNNFFVNHFLLTCAVQGSGPTDLRAGYDAYRRLRPMRISNFSSAMTQVLRQGEAGIGIHHDAETFAAIGGGAPMGFARWPGFTPIVDQSVAVCRGTSATRQRLAFAFANRMVSAEFQQRMAERLFTQGTNRKMVVPAAMEKMGVVNSPSAAANRWVAPWEFWLEKEAEVVETVNQIYAG